MKSFFILSLICLSLGLASGKRIKAPPAPIGEYIYKTFHAEGDSPQLRASINAYLDQVFLSVRQLLSIIPQIPLPELLDIAIADGISVNLTEGSLTGMTTLHRTGECELNLEPNDDIVLIVDVGGNDFALLYTLGLELGGEIWRPLPLEGHLNRVDLRLALRVGYDFSIRVEELDIKNVGKLTLKLDGLGDLINIIVQGLSQIIGAMLKDSVSEWLSTVLRDLLNSILDPVIPEIYEIGHKVGWARSATPLINQIPFNNFQ